MGFTVEQVATRFRSHASCFSIVEEARIRPFRALIDLQHISVEQTESWSLKGQIPLAICTTFLTQIK